MAERIVVLRAGALGDTVLTLPALRALRARHPQTSLQVVGYPDIWEVAGPLVDEAVSIDLPIFAGLLAAPGSRSLSAPLIEWLRGADLVVSWTVRDPTAALMAMGVPHVIHASPYPPPGVHAADWLLQSVGEDGFAVPDLDLRDEEKETGRAALAGLGHPVIIHPGAGAAWKRWPAPRFARLGEELTRRGERVALLEGPADADAVVQVRAIVDLPVLREASPRRLAALLSQARLFIGNDSGVSHLAAAAGAPTIALFGPTDPASWAPRGRVRVLRACTTQPERQGQVRVCEDPACMEGLDVQDVLAALESGDGRQNEA